MRIFVAGATGVLGRAILPHLIQHGHRVGGLTRTPSKANYLRGAGVVPFVCDVFDQDKLTGIVCSFRPGVVIHQLTDLPDDASEVNSKSADNARIRVTGTKNLLHAAHAAGASKVMAQSVAWELPWGPAADAVAQLEALVLEAHGVVLRYGRLYGPGTYYPIHAPAHPRVHVEAAAIASVRALRSPSGIVLVKEAHRT